MAWSQTLLSCIMGNVGCNSFGTWPILRTKGQDISTLRVPQLYTSAILYNWSYNWFTPVREISSSSTTLWQKFGDGSFLFQNDSVPVLKLSSMKKCFTQFAMEELDWAAPQPHPTPLGLTGTPTVSQTLSPSVLDLANALVSELEQNPAAGSNIWWKAWCLKPEEWRLLQQINEHSVTTCSTLGMFGCPHTFDHVVYQPRLLRSTLQKRKPSLVSSPY